MSWGLSLWLRLGAVFQGSQGTGLAPSPWVPWLVHLPRSQEAKSVPWGGGRTLHPGLRTPLQLQGGALGLELVLLLSSRLCPQSPLPRRNGCWCLLVTWPVGGAGAGTEPPLQLCPLGALSLSPLPRPAPEPPWGAALERPQQGPLPGEPVWPCPVCAALVPPPCCRPCPHWAGPPRPSSPLLAHPHPSSPRGPSLLWPALQRPTSFR